MCTSIVFFSSHVMMTSTESDHAVYTLHMMCPILLKCSEPRRNHSLAWKLGLLAIIWLCVWCISPVVAKIHNIFLSLMFILDSFNKEYWGETYAIFDTIIVLFLCFADFVLHLSFCFLERSIYVQRFVVEFDYCNGKLIAGSSYVLWRL